MSSLTHYFRSLQVLLLICALPYDLRDIPPLPQNCFGGLLPPLCLTEFRETRVPLISLPHEVCPLHRRINGLDHFQSSLFTHFLIITQRRQAALLDIQELRPKQSFLFIEWRATREEIFDYETCALLECGGKFGDKTLLVRHVKDNLLNNTCVVLVKKTFIDLIQILLNKIQILSSWLLRKQVSHFFRIIYAILYYVNGIDL